MAVFNTARVRLFATHSHNPLVVYKAFQFAIILAKILVLFLPRPLGYNCNDFKLLFLYSSHIMHEHACARAGSAHACIVAHMDLYIIVMAYSHTLKYTVHLHIPDIHVRCGIQLTSLLLMVHTLTNIVTCTCIYSIY